MNRSKLQAHIKATYRSLRVGLALLGLALPWVLWIGGRMTGRHLEGSMSAYYFTQMRDELVGTLIAVGALLILYKGYTTIENWVLNAAGAFLAGVALFHMNPPNCGGGCPGFNPHGLFAVLFFLCIAYVCIFRASDTLGLMRDEPKASLFRRTYRFLGILMIASPVIAVALRYMLQAPSGERSLIFFVEASGVYVFAIYWIVKSLEISITESERLAAEGKLATPSLGLKDVLKFKIPVELAVSDETEPDLAAAGQRRPA